MPDLDTQQNEDSYNFFKLLIYMFVFKISHFD